MYKKYIIEKKDLALLSSSYQHLGELYSSNFEKMNKIISKINNAKKSIIDLNNSLDSITNENVKLYNQLKFIKKNYLPRIYINTYVKNNKPNRYVNLIINYFDYSKTIYLGKKNEIETLLSNLNFNHRPFKTSIISYLKPIILAKCAQLRNKSEFISLKINSNALFNSDNIPINQIEPESFSSYLKQFD